MDFEELYRAYIRIVWRYVRARIPSYAEAQDVSSDVFVRAWRSRERYQPQLGTVRTWLMAISHHAVADWWRHRSRQRESLNPEPFGIEMDGRDRSPETALLDSELRQELQQGLRTLSDRERDALALRFSGELKAAEIGGILGMTEGAVKMMIHRAVLKLKAVMVHGER